ncbi:MAG: glycosyltransferase family 4 protein [Candidatus Pacebacteria bacterium]|nr:glycosyltransferase family 4 protein [Candidatus Paceibacterota bacterium]
MTQISKKILIFSTAYFPFVGGAEVAVKEITDRISDMEFHMITARMDKKLPKQEKIGNITVFRIGIGHPKIDKLLLAFHGHRMAGKLQRQNNYDIAWAIMASYGALAASRFISKERKRPLPSAKAAPRFLLTLQEGDSPEHIEKRTRFIKKQFRNIFRRADRIQCISSYLADWAKKMGATCPIEVIPNGVDINKFKSQKSKVKSQKLREELKIKENEKVILTVSRLVKKNGIEDLIKAGQYLNFPFKILIAGAGEDEEKLKNLAKELNLQNKIIFLGHIDHSELPSYYALADVFVRPSLSEGLGNVFLEAMAAGTPVIGTPVGGIPDFLKDGETGLFCEVQNPKSIAEKIQLLLNNPNLANTLTQNASQLIAQKYDWNLIAKKMQNIFEKMIK